MVGIGLRDLDDEAGLAANNLFCDAQVGAQLGASKPLGENAGNLEAGGTVAHRRLLPRLRGRWPIYSHSHAGAHVRRWRAVQLCQDIVAIATRLHGGTYFQDAGRQRLL